MKNSLLLKFIPWAMALLLSTGCQPSTPPSPPASVESGAPAETYPEADGEPAVIPQPAQAPRPIPTISLGGASSTGTSDTAPLAGIAGTNSLPNAGSVAGPVDQRRDEIVNQLKDLQVMLGGWRGTTQKEFGDFKAIDHPNWVWDFLSAKEQPALVMTSPESPYFRSARLTYLPESEKFRLETKDSEGTTRTFEGAFSVPVEEFQGDDRKLHKRYKLELTQTDAPTPRDAWQVVFNQQDNNRYLVELAKRRGSGFLRFDTVATQREGTSFAKSDTDYGDKECIISGGLGTIQVSYQGKSYWVCCTGCKAAFDEEPAKWIAEAAAKKAKSAN